MRLNIKFHVFRLISPNQKRLIACYAIKHGADAEWEFAYQKYLQSDVANEKRELLSAMSCSREQWLLTRCLFCFPHFCVKLLKICAHFMVGCWKWWSTPSLEFACKTPITCSATWLITRSAISSLSISYEIAGMISIDSKSLPTSQLPLTVPWIRFCAVSAATWDSAAVLCHVCFSRLPAKLTHVWG